MVRGCWVRCAHFRQKIFYRPKSQSGSDRAPVISSEFGSLKTSFNVSLLSIKLFGLLWLCEN